MMRKQLIVAVEGTAAMGPYWKTIVSNYLEKTIRAFTEADSTEQNPSAGDAELSLVVFNVHSPYSDCMLQRSGWTRDIDMFFQWLSAIHFSGGGFDDAAVTQGLDAALMMYSSLNGSETQENADGRRHCLLVAASNPHPLPVYCHAMQKLELSGNTEAHISSCLADAETIAKTFPQCFVSLSVICPRKLPKFRTIYNAGKPDPQAADPPIDTSENPNFLVLISENFSEACAALCHTEMTSLTPNQSLVEMSMFSVPPVSGPAVTSNPAVMNQQQISAGNIPAAIVDIETMVTSVTGPAPPHQCVASLESASSTSVSEEMVPNNENTKETTPVVSVMTQSLHPFSGTAGNVRILNAVASAIPAAPAALSYETLGVTSMTWFAPFEVTGEIVPFEGTGQIAENFVPASITSMVPIMSGNSNLCMSQLLSNIQGGIGAGSQTEPVMSQRNLPGSQMVQSGIGMHWNVPSGMGTGTPSGIGTTMPTPAMTQQGQPGMLPLGRNNSTEANTSLSQKQTSAILPSAQSSYAKFWEGGLSVLKQGQHVHITRLEGYKRASASESLAANWLPTMQISGLIDKEHMIEHVRRWTGKVDHLVFRAMEQHLFLDKVHENKFCAVIQLPTQTLLLSVDRPDRLLGLLFPRENAKLEPKIPNQQLPAHHPRPEQLLPQRPLPQLQQQRQKQPHSLQLKQQQPLSLLQQQQQQSLEQLPHQQPPRPPLKRQLNGPLQQQSKVPRIHQQTPQTQQQQQVLQIQQIEQQQPIVGTAVINQAYMQGTGKLQLISQTQASSSQGLTSTPEEDLLIEHYDELDALLIERGDEFDNAIAELNQVFKTD